MVRWPRAASLARGAIAPFRFVAEGEQRFTAAGLRAGLRDRDHLVRSEKAALAAARRWQRNGRNRGKAW